MYTHNTLHTSPPQSFFLPTNAAYNFLNHESPGISAAIDEHPTDSGFDHEQRTSAALQHNHGAHSLPAPLPHVDTMSTSPAAMFLSAFSPSVAPTSPPDSEGQVVAGYTLGSIVGYGGFSTIRRASSASGGVVAVKIVRRSDISKHANASKRLKHEASVWASFSHEHILPLFSAVHTSYADYFFTLLCPAGSLFDILKRDGSPALQQDDAGMMFRQVVRGLRYLHEVALSVHRDIKLENVLVDEMGVCRIGDFGMTRKIDELDEDEFQLDHEPEQDAHHASLHRAATLAASSSKRQARPSLGAHLSISRHNGARYRHSTSSAPVDSSIHVFQPGSLPYASPELLLPQTSGPLRPHPGQDIWALGVLLYALLTGRLPFADSFEPRLQMKILNGVYEMPHDVGRGAERVLQGCIERSVSSRWTIAMVDEVAWGIGWGSEGDDVTPADSDGEYETPQRVTPTRSRSRPADITIPLNPDWQYEEPRTRPSLEAASRRSSSRVKRSMSRAPVLTERSISSRRTGRSMSRPPSPTFSALNSSILSPSSMSGSSSCSSNFDDSALIVSPPCSRERGRRLQKSPIQSSRSPSPSLIPTTPIDVPGRFPVSVDTQTDDLDIDSSRGRNRFSRHAKSLRPSHYYPADVAVAELDVLDETAGWAGPESAKRAPSTARSCLTALLDTHNRREESALLWTRADSEHEAQGVKISPRSKKPRPESTPPAPTSAWSITNGISALRFGGMHRSHQSSGDGFLTACDLTSAASMARNGARSKSVGYECHGD